MIGMGERALANNVSAGTNDPSNVYEGTSATWQFYMNNLDPGWQLRSGGWCNWSFGDSTSSSYSVGPPGDDVSLSFPHIDAQDGYYTRTVSFQIWYERTDGSDDHYHYTYG